MTKDAMPPAKSRSEETGQPQSKSRGRRPTVIWSSELVAELVAEREAGATLASLARRLRVSRERVRQVLTERGYGDLSTTAAAARTQERASRNAEDAVALHSVIQESPELTWREIADAVGVPLSRVFALVSAEDREAKAATPRDLRTYTDDDLLDALTRAARDVNRILTYAAFQSWSRRRRGAPSAAVITFRFGSWANALDAAGLPKNSPRRRSRAFRLEPEHLTGWVARYLETGGSTSASAYDEWAKNQPGAPSASLIRHRLGWVNAREEAVQLLAEGVDLSHLPGTGGPASAL